MAHKKAGGSTRNGRDSAGRRLGVKNLVESSLSLVILLSDNEGRNFTQEKTFQLAKITQYLQLKKVLFLLKNHPEDHL